MLLIRSPTLHDSMQRAAFGVLFRDFKDMVYPFFESDTLFLECFVCVVFSSLAILRIEGYLNSTLLESPNCRVIARDA